MSQVSAAHSCRGAALVLGAKLCLLPFVGVPTPLQDPQKPATVDNLVLLTHAEADDHDQLQSLDALRQQVRSCRQPGRSRQGGAEGRTAAAAQVTNQSNNAALWPSLLSPWMVPPNLCNLHRCQPSSLVYRPQEPELCARVEATLARAKRDFWWRI